MPPELAEMDIDQRIDVSMAVDNYTRAVEQLDIAQKEFEAACNAVRSSVGPNRRLCCKSRHVTYLVTTDEHGEFNVDPIEAIG